MTNTTHTYGPDGLTPRELGTAILASGNIAIVQPNGDVSDIIPSAEWDRGIVDGPAEDYRWGY